MSTILTSTARLRRPHNGRNREIEQQTTDLWSAAKFIEVAEEDFVSRAAVSLLATRIADNAIGVSVRGGRLNWAWARHSRQLCGRH